MPGGLAIAVMVMGTILAAPIGVVGAAVVLLSMISLPPMLAAGYDKRLAIGTIASAGTLGILIPPAIMLVVMARDAVHLGGRAVRRGDDARASALGTLPALHLRHRDRAARLGAALPSESGPQTRGGILARIVMEGPGPMTFLMVVVLGSIFAGFATTTESAGVGVLGSLLIAWMNGRLTMPMMKEVDPRRLPGERAWCFMLFLGATGFSYVFRVLGGDDVMISTLALLGIDTKWEILSFVMVLIFLLGFPFEWIEICLIVLPVFTPILLKLDFSDHLGNTACFMPWFGTLVAVNLQPRS